MKKALVICRARFDGENIGGAGVYTAAALAELEVSTAVLTKADGKNADKLRDFFGQNGVSESIIIGEDEDFPKISPEKFDAVFITGEFVLDDEESRLFAKKICAECRKIEVPVVFDPGNSGGKSAAETVGEIAANAEIFVPSVEDAEIFCGLSEPKRIADYYLSAGVKKIVVKLDKAGAYYESRVESGTAPTFRADRVVDLTGAGDAFAAGLISGVIEKIPLSEAVVRANACGCCAIQSEGFTFPSLAGLREYMLTHRFVVDACKEY